MEKVSIIIPVHNNLSYTKQCLESIAYNTEYENFDVIIVNNASTDGTAEYLATLDLPIKGKVIHNKENKTYSVVNNQARSATDADYLVLLNNDTIVTKGWLKGLVKAAKDDEDVGVVGCKLIFPGGGTIQHAGVYYMHHGIPDHSFIGYDRFDTVVCERKTCPAVTGACLLTHVDVWDTVNGLDERYKFGYEDIAYCNSVYELGLKVVYEPNVEVYHYGSVTPGRYDYENANFNIYIRDWVVNDKFKTIIRKSK